MKHIYTLICLFTLTSFNASSQNDLIGTWYLDHVVKEGVTHPNYFNSYTVFSLEFTNNSGDLPGTLSFSSGHGCNASNGSYSVGTNEITINTSGTTLADCLTAPYAIYEELYYDELNCNDGLDCIGLCGGSSYPNFSCLNGELVCSINNCYDLAINSQIIPDNYTISSIHPNPFNPITTITYGLPKNTNIYITVFNLSGIQITTLENTFQTAGYHTTNWNASSYPSGVYLIRMDSGEFAQTQKVVLVK